MKMRREFEGQVSAEDAEARAVKLLKSMRFRQLECATHLKFVRGKRNSSLWAFRPRSFEAALNLWIEGHGVDYMKTILELEVREVFQPPHRQAELFFYREMHDLQEGILTNTPPKFNRLKQNRLAGYVHAAYMVFMLAVSVALGYSLAMHLPLVGVLVGLAFFLMMVYLAKWRVLILPEFEVHLPRGAKIVPDPEPEVQTEIHRTGAKTQ